MRVSWSILNAWARGDKEGAMSMLLGESIPPTPAMLEGQRVHGWVAQEKMKLLPFMDDTFVWEGPEHHGAGYFRVEFLPNYQLSGKVDAYSIERGWLIDWKTGKTPSSTQDPRQLHLYHFLLKQSLGATFHSGAIAHISSEAKVLDWTRVQLSEGKATDAAAWAMETIGEIKAHLVDGMKVDHLTGEILDEQKAEQESIYDMED